MNTWSLFLVPVLIWGSTWFAITYQLGKVPPEVSVSYRFAVAGLILLGWCGVRKLRLRFSWRDHVWIALEGALLFGLNYVCVYLAESRLTSGFVAVVFSLIVFFNIVGTRVFFGTPMKRTTLLSAFLGVTGVALVFTPQFQNASLSRGMTAGIGFVIASTILASLGNMVAVRNHRSGLPLIQLNMFGMLYGSLFVGAYALVTGRPFVFDLSMGYVLSLAYLALFGSVLAFGAYLTLVGRIGADRAGYFGASTPVIAVLVSVMFEGLRLHAVEMAGIALCVAGNILVLQRRANMEVRRPAASRA